VASAENQFTNLSRPLDSLADHHCSQTRRRAG
jgi:hypothetical protein